MEHVRLNSRPRVFAARYLLITALLLLCASAPASATTITAQDTDDLKAALGQGPPHGSVTAPAAPGDTIVLVAGHTYTGTFVLPALTNPNGLYVTIQSSDLSSLPDGQRVNPTTDQSHMPRLVSPPLQPALRTAPGASYYRILGIEFTMPNQDGLQTDDSLTTYDIVRFGDASYTSDTQSPHHLVLDRCYVHGWPTRHVKRGVEIHSVETSITNSYISEIHWGEGDSQGIGGWNGRGPYHIVNNYVEAAGENVMLGGATPNILGLVASGIEVRRNHLYKPLRWRPGSSDYDGFNWRVKNLLEFKSAKNAVVEGNLMENSWSDMGYGAINLYEDHDSGDQVTLQHITVKNNILRNTGYGVLVTGKAGNGPSEQGYDIKIINNLFYNLTSAWGGQYGTWMEVNSVNDLVIDHNTVIQSYWVVAIQQPVVTGTKMTGFVFTNNVCTYGSYGFFADVGGYGESGFTANLINPVFSGNVIIYPGQSQAGLFPSYTTNNFWPASEAAVGFVNSAQGNYRLLSTSPYKGAAPGNRDIGADFDAIDAAMGNTASVVVSDTFTGASGTPLSSHVGETGASWTKHPSYPGTSYISNANRMRGGADSLYYASGVPATADYDVQADFCGMAQNASTPGIAGRVSTTGDTFYRVIFDIPNTGQYLLQKVNAGVVTTLQGVGPWQWGGNFADGSTHSFKLQMRGTSLKVFIDGVERMSATDSSITAAGRAGVYTRSYSMTDTWGIHLDNFTVTNAVTAQPAQFVSDTFTDTANLLLSSHTGEAGASWTKHPSYPGTSYISNANRMRGGADSLYYASGVPSGADYDVQADFCGMAQNASTPGIAGRVSTTGDDAYRVIFDVPNTGKYLLQKVNAGVVTVLQGVGPWEWGGNFADGSTHTVKLMMRGSSIKVFIDGVERMSATDSTVTAAGRAGVYTRSYSMTDTWGIHLDNFVAVNAP